MAKNSSNQIHNYVPFARKYRPKNFGELLGQEVLVKTLSYCINNNRLAQAHLLTGIRGVGKTSSARIIAKTVNCTNPQDSKEQKASYIMPCESCENCISFNNHNHPDIIEIDAASRTSIDDIREIIESSEYRPLLGKMKFFIIDEIHMLSKSAFNALLKIVEEPPEHVIFIFATTEVQKMPLTVISRCQRYDLRRLNFNEVHKIADNIAKQEGLKFDEEALKIIAARSEGSARDATSMMDQAASYMHYFGDGETINAKLIEQMLGLVQTDSIIKLIQLIIANNPKSAIDLLERIYNSTSNLENFVQSISDALAELCKYKIIDKYKNPLYEPYLEQINTILIGTSFSRLSILWQIFSKGALELKQTHNELVCVEMLIIKAVYACNLPPAEEIMQIESEKIIETHESESKSPIKPVRPIVNNFAEEPSQKINKKEVDDGNSEQVKSDNNLVDHNLLDFLKFCHKNNEFQTYYFLLNEIEIGSFTNNELALIGECSKDMQSKIEGLLTDWSSKNWQISIRKDDKIESLKQKMLKKVKLAEDYQIIKKYFPDANISDILLG